MFGFMIEDSPCARKITGMVAILASGKEGLPSEALAKEGHSNFSRLAFFICSMIFLISWD